MLKEAYSDQEIINQFEQLKPTIIRLSEVMGGCLGLPDLRSVENFQYHSTADWKLMSEPWTEVADSTAVYFESYQTIGINLDNVRNRLRTGKNRASRLNVSREKQLTALGLWISIHEGIIHPNCQSQLLMGEHKQLALEATCLKLELADRKELIPFVGESSVVDVSGARVRSLLTENVVVSMGTIIDESLAYLLTLRAMQPLFKSYLGETKEGWFYYLLSTGALTDRIVDVDNWAAITPFESKIGHGTLARNYFQGEFLNRFIFNQPKKQKYERFALLVIDQPVELFSTLTNQS